MSIFHIIVGTTSSIKSPFTEERARAKVKAAQDAWNTKNPEVVAQAYTSDSQWRNAFTKILPRTITWHDIFSVVSIWINIIIDLSLAVCALSTTLI